jgi:hypothetical protein
MLDLARSLGWLSPAGQRAELMRMIGEELAASSVSSNEVDLICALNKNRELDPELDRLRIATAQANKVGHAGILACLGNAEAHGRMLRALTSTNDEEVQVAQVYLQHRPITDASELQGVATAIARMKGSDTQVRALDVLARYHLSDRESLDELTRLFPLAKSLNVQRAIAGILIRSDYKTIAKAELARALRQHRLKSPDGEDLIDALIRRLQAS